MLRTMMICLACLVNVDGAGIGIFRYHDLQLMLTKKEKTSVRRVDLHEGPMKRDDDKCK